MARDLDELLDAYMDQEKLYRIEGRQGVENLCTLARAVGYKDPMYFGQLSSRAAIGDLICMLEDNPGMIEAIHNWIRDQNSPEMVAALEEQVTVDGDLAHEQYEGGVCPDCGEEINPTAVRGDACDNCGHVFNWGESDDE